MEPQAMQWRYTNISVTTRKTGAQVYENESSGRQTYADAEGA